MDSLQILKDSLMNNHGDTENAERRLDLRGVIVDLGSFHIINLPSQILDLSLCSPCLRGEIFVLSDMIYCCRNSM